MTICGASANKRIGTPWRSARGAKRMVAQARKRQHTSVWRAHVRHEQAVVQLTPPPHGAREEPIALGAFWVQEQPTEAACRKQRGIARAGEMRWARRGGLLMPSSILQVPVPPRAKKALAQARQKAAVQLGTATGMQSCTRNATRAVGRPPPSGGGTRGTPGRALRELRAGPSSAAPPGGSFDLSGLRRVPEAPQLLDCRVRILLVVVVLGLAVCSGRDDTFQL